MRPTTAEIQKSNERQDCSRNVNTISFTNSALVSNERIKYDASLLLSERDHLPKGAVTRVENTMLKPGQQEGLKLHLNESDAWIPIKTNVMSTGESKSCMNTPEAKCANPSLSNSQRKRSVRIECHIGSDSVFAEAWKIKSPNTARR